MVNSVKTRMRKIVVFGIIFVLVLMVFMGIASAGATAKRTFRQHKCPAKCEAFLYMEDFTRCEYWLTDAYSWSLHDWQIAGGNPPAIGISWVDMYYLNWNDDPETLISPVFDTSKASDLNLEFKHYVSFIEDVGEPFLVEVYARAESVDDWSLLYSVEVDEDIGPEVLQFDISEFIGSGTRIMFWTNAIWTDIDCWLIDDVRIYETPCEGVTLVCPKQLDEGIPPDVYGTVYYTDSTADSYQWLVDGEVVFDSEITTNLTLTQLNHDFSEPGLYYIELRSTFTGPRGEITIDSKKCRLFMAPEGNVLELVDISDCVARLKDCVKKHKDCKVSFKIKFYNTLPRDMPLLKDELTVDLPDGFEIVKVNGPDVIKGNSYAKLHVLVSIDFGTKEGDYEFVVNMPYLIRPGWHQLNDGVWWCGDDDLGTYDDDYYEELIFHDVAVPEENPGLYLNHSIQSEISYISVYDGGCVQVSKNDGVSWELIVPRRGYDSEYVDALGGPGFVSLSGYTAEDIFDLSAYAGLTVDIKFVFASDYASHNFDGWYISVVAVGQIEVIPAAWTVLNNGDNHMGVTWEWDDQDQSVHCSWGGMYEYQEEWLISPAIDLTTAVNPRLNFTQYVEYWKFDNAPNCVMVSTTDTNPSNFTEVYSIEKPDTVESPANIDLGNYSGQVIYIAWLYQSKNGEMWEIDNILVSDDSGIIYSETFGTNTLANTLVVDSLIDITDSGNNGELTGTLTVKHRCNHHMKHSGKRC